ncbi:response regulator transcription factor [Rhodanobacter aciditrophus]|uniref:Response regulator transcription factor n=1 Tax=Rhodanobacter aciditrophus TaxID=1623218 RepID=A0ABW4B000_9GAMM
MFSDMTMNEIKLFADIVAKLESYQCNDVEVRESVLTDLAKLLRCEHACSYILDPQSQHFIKGINENISEDAQKIYTDHYQFHDPITFKMRALGCSTVEEVIDYKDYYRTDYYNDVMKKDGLKYGINLYLFDEGRDIGDFRLWRGKNQENFDSREKGLLRILEPYLKRSILKNENNIQLINTLTSRERDVVELIAKGFTDREIGQYLNIGFSTVRTHLNKSLQKLGCANRAELAVQFNTALH